MKDVVFEFVDKDLAASWSKRILLEAYTHRMDEVTAKKAVILVDSLDPKQPIDIVNKYVKSILDLAQKPSSVMMVDFSQVDLFYKALSYIDWKSTNCIVCVGSKIVLNPLELLFFETTRNHVGSSDIVSSFTNWNESDALELAISILKEPLGKKIAVACSNLHKRNSTNLITSLKNLSRGGMKSAASIERLDHQ